jgi:hypothetical protein
MLSSFVRVVLMDDLHLTSALSTFADGSPRVVAGNVDNCAEEPRAARFVEAMSRLKTRDQFVGS